MIELPAEFRDRMRRMLGEEYDGFMESFGRERLHGLRLNLLKTSADAFLAKSPFMLKPVPWAKEGFYYDNGDRPGRHPYHEAGVYYIQEPSAMAVVTFLEPQPGEKILDLCAAPGGKTTQIASRMQGKGLLISNEIHPDRAKALSGNVERMGARNTVVTNESPGRLAECFPEFFDRIVVDAPCSGEGMFRKDEEAVKEWSSENVRRCALRQQEILDRAALMLKSGGRLVYSTCTFAPEENEMTVGTFLLSHPEFTIEETPSCGGLLSGVKEWGAGVTEGIERTIRIWPHKAGGEGHFIAVLRKRSGGRVWKRKKPSYLHDRKALKDYFDFCEQCFIHPKEWTKKKELVLYGEQLYLLPEEMPGFDRLKVLRPGLHMGGFKKNRFEPSHALALALNKNEVRKFRDYPAMSSETVAYLHGETIMDPSPTRENGWVLINVDGYSLGFSKLSGGVLKNHYPKGLRK